MRIKLREMMALHAARTGKRMTYASLSQASGLSLATLQSMAARDGYNTRLSSIEKICIVLGCQPGELLELTPRGKK